jgi:hypothetical protein
MNIIKFNIIVGNKIQFLLYFKNPKSFKSIRKYLLKD